MRHVQHRKKPLTVLVAPLSSLVCSILHQYCFNGRFRDTKLLAQETVSGDLGACRAARALTDPTKNKYLKFVFRTGVSCTFSTWWWLLALWPLHPHKFFLISAAILAETFDASWLIALLAKTSTVPILGSCSSSLGMSYFKTRGR